MSTKFNKIVKNFKDVMTTKKTETKPYDTVATVTKVEDDTVWVEIPGGYYQTPVRKTINASEGDKVQVRVSGGQAWITGNGTAPPTDDKKANKAYAQANSAQESADDALDVAMTTKQYFWNDDSGVHVSSEKSNPTATRNTIWNSLGMLFRKGANNLLAIVTGDNPGVEIYDGQGNNTSNIVASFKSTAIIGSSTNSSQNLSISPTGGIQFRKGTTTYGKIIDSSSNLLIQRGTSSNSQILMKANALELSTNRDGNDINTGMDMQSNNIYFYGHLYAAGTRMGSKTHSQISIQSTTISIGTIGSGGSKSGSEDIYIDEAHREAQYSGRCAVGWDFSGGGSSYLNLSGLYVNQTSQEIKYSIRNTRSSATDNDVTLKVLVLCTVNELW